MGSSLKVVSFEGRGTVETAAGQVSKLRDAIEENEQVVLNLSRLEQIDASFVHVLYAAATEAKNSGTRFGLTGTLQENVRAALEIGGFCDTAPEEAKELHSLLLDFPLSEQPKEAPDA